MKLFRPACLRTPWFSTHTAVVCATLALLTIGCRVFDSGGETRRRHNSKLVDFLYPRGDHIRPTSPGTPTLTLPLKVGLAWVPESFRSGNQPIQRAGDPVLTEAQQKQLADAVIPHFQKYSFISSIQTMPSAYLTPGGGFENLDQLRSLLGIDIIVLLSFDQLQTAHNTELSVLYWTIVGAYLIPAEANRTHTMVDAAVFDIASRQLLFRAPGVSKTEGLATLVRSDQQLQDKSALGFQQAATNMVANLETELTAFQKRLKEQPATARVIRSPGYTGAGAWDWAHVSLFGGVVVLGMFWQRRKA